MNIESIISDCANKGFEITFRSTQYNEIFECCIERDGQFRGAKPFSAGSNLHDAAINAARYARVPGY